MKKKLMIGIFAAMMVFAGAYAASAQMNGCPGGPADGVQGMPPMPEMHPPAIGMMEGLGPGPRMWRNLISLGLDDKQKEEIKAIKDKVMKETIMQEADLRIASIELKEILDDDPVDMKAVEARLQRMETVRTALRLSHIRAMEEIKSKLTPEQRKKLMAAQKMAPIRQPRMERMMHGGMRMPPPP